ncbi:MAG TPA: universal stress protein [Solirubrobacteraceae bacterium]|nr:universal stress protein [Solirubrobacteraceae bacterium]
MAAAEITERVASIDADGHAPAVAVARRGVAVVCERSAEGRAALLYASRLAARAGRPLTVLAVSSEERTDIGCGCGRQAAAFRNTMHRELATEELSEAREVVAAAHPGVPVAYLLARGGSFIRAVRDAADRHDVDVIVLPAPRTGPLRRICSRDRAERLRRRTASTVIVAPPGAA